MFSADIQPSCASCSMLHPVHHHLSTGTAEALVRSVFYKRMRGRQNRPTWSVFFWTGRIFFARNLPGFLFPPPVSSKILGKKIRFFPQYPKITWKSWDFTGSLLWIGHISLFSLCMSKNRWNFGHNRKKPPSMPKNKAGEVLKCSYKAVLYQKCWPSLFRERKTLGYPVSDLLKQKKLLQKNSGTALP